MLHTGLGEEGGESMIVVRRLALFGEEAVRLERVSAESPHPQIVVCSYLNAVLEAVELYHPNVSISLLRQPNSSVRRHFGSTCQLCADITDLPAAVGDLAAGLAD